MEEKNITYVFGVGRRNIVNNPNYSDEFFYGFKYFKEDFDNVQFIEFYPELNKKFIIIDKLLSKISNLPFYFNNIISRQNRKIFKNTDICIFTNERMLISSLIYLTLLKRNNIKSLVIIMGLFSKTTNSTIKNLFQKIFINFTLSLVDNIVFLGEGELEIAKKNYPKFIKKYSHIPFMLNKNFWIKKDDIKLIERDKILFIGNDGKRDYKLVLEIAKKMPEFEFIIVSKIITKDQIKSENIKLINGYWNENILDDRKIQEIYDQARLTILPLVQSRQPSGQSVALQSMSRGVPVIISQTEGFWDKKNFVNMKNIIFAKKSSVDYWKRIINNSYHNEELLIDISNNGIDLMKNLSDSRDFYERLKKILF